MIFMLEVFRRNAHTVRVFIDESLFLAARKTEPPVEEGEWLEAWQGNSDGSPLQQIEFVDGDCE